MSRYWVNLGTWDVTGEISGVEGEELLREQQTAEEIEAISLEIEESEVGLVYKTTDLEDAETIYRQAVEIVKKRYGDEVTAALGITRQPECPSCHYLARFSENYCPRCGTKLLPQEDMTPE